MQAIFSTRRSLALYLLTWLMLGAILAAIVAVSSAGGWLNSLLLALPLTLVYAVGAGFSAYSLCRAFPLAERRPLEIVATFVIAAVVSALLWLALTHLWNNLLSALGVAWAGLAIERALSGLIFGYGVLLYGLSAIGNYLVIEFERTRSAERRELESTLMARDAELRMLRSQIDPHFLFNSLNSISALTSQNPHGAREMTLQLADFFRLSLGLAAHRKITLGAEIALTLKFLEIEKVRFGARLRIEVEIDPQADGCLVLPMLIQPLVENAVKHGIGNLTEGGTVALHVQRTGSQLHISVANDIDHDQAAARRPGNGIGLANVGQRLAAAYGHEAHVSWGRQADGFRVDIRLPAEAAETTPDVPK